MSKRLFSFLLAALLTLCLLPAAASAVCDHPAERVSAPDDDKWFYDETCHGKQKCLECGEILDGESHCDDNGNGVCDVCRGPVAISGVNQFGHAWTLDTDGNLTVSAYDGEPGYAVKNWNGIGRQITSAVINSGVTNISGKYEWNRYEFAECRGLTSIVIGKDVTDVDAYVIMGCEKLATITVDAENGYFSSVGGILYSKDGKTLVACPGRLTGTACIPEGVTVIGEAAFKYAGLTGVTLPSTLKQIGEAAFYCSSLNSIEIPAGVESIGESAFTYSSIQNAVIPPSVTSIGSGAFYGVTADVHVDCRWDKSIASGASGELTWVDGHVPVTLDPNGGSGEGEICLLCGAGTAEPAAERLEETALTDMAFSRVGYGFDGWNTKADGTGDALAAADTLGDLSALLPNGGTLYAQWAVNTYAVTFDANGGSGTTETQGFTYDAEPAALNANGFSRDGYLFAGWNTAADGSGESYGDEAPVRNLTASANGNVTLYAQWKQTGWGKTDGKWYYFDPATGVERTGWQKIDGKWYYLGTDGAMLTGWQQVGEKRYYLGMDGAMKTGWLQLGGRSYYLGATGAMKTGWQQLGGARYYFGSDGAARTGWAQVGGVWYYFSTSGVMKTGWASVNGKWYYLGTDGAMKTGWASVNGKWYYLGTDGAMKTGWASVNGKWYYLGTDGAMKTGWASVNGKWYYLDTNGAMKTGWANVNGKWYYLKASGAMARDESLAIGGRTYRFSASGVCANP